MDPPSPAYQLRGRYCDSDAAAAALAVLEALRAEAPKAKTTMTVTDAASRQGIPPFELLQRALQYQFVSFRSATGYTAKSMPRYYS